MSTTDAGPSVVATMCSPGGPAVVCSGPVEQSCAEDGSVASERRCVDEGLVCVTGLGCRTCVPNRGRCQGNAALVCQPDGNGFGAEQDCGELGLVCSNDTGTCADLCAEAEASNSYIGCEYWPTPVTNPVATEFEFAVVVANPQAIPANVMVERSGATAASVTIAPNSVETVRLPWVDALKGASMPRPGNPTERQPASALVRGGAYRLSSNVPVTVYQFNPLEYEISRDCLDEEAAGRDGSDGRCNSFTNDASLLLPTHALTGNYMVLSYPTRHSRARLRDDLGGGWIDDPDTGEIYEGWLSAPGYAAIVAVDDTDVEVDFTAHVAASADGAVTSHAPGDTGRYSLRRGDVLQLVTQAPERTCVSSVPDDEMPADCGFLPCTRVDTYCDVDRTYDLTGTVVRTTGGGRVAVISGHECAFVPYNRWACDHLEESMFPLESWGSDFVVSTTQPLRGEPNLIRVMSGSDTTNAIAFDPPVHAPVNLGRGDFVEFEASEDFRVTGAGPILVGQFLVGQDYAGPATSGPMGNGDPALSLAIPTEQFRTSYSFLAPTTYEQSYVNVTAMVGQDVVLDGAAVSGFRTVGTTGMATARVSVSGGNHEITSSQPFGIVVYGFGAYTSYMYPGGLDLEVINIF